MNSSAEAKLHLLDYLRGIRLRLGPSVKTAGEVEKLLDLPVLAVIPKGIRILPRTTEDTLDGEAYRVMTTHVDTARRKVAASLINVVSSGPSEGKSTTVCNLATAYAASGQQTLIIDCNLRRPTQHQLFDLENRVGLSDFLEGEVAIEQVIQVSHIANLYVIASGADKISAVTMLNSNKMRELVDTMKDWFDVVIFDCPPILGESDALVVSALVEASIIVAQHRKTPRSVLVRVKAALQDTGSNCLGVVLNNVDIANGPNNQSQPRLKEKSAKPLAVRREEQAHPRPEPLIAKKPKKSPRTTSAVEQLETETLTKDIY
jgi:polysaccharide biosynthesis transport protein